tara:strand:- start:337 stop:666 length:330 start_codon:yes stop_codon:yes gene_type:complete
MGYEALELLIETIKDREDFDTNYVDPSLFDIQNELAFHQENRRALKIQIDEMYMKQKNLKAVVYNEYALLFKNENNPYLFVWLATVFAFFASLVRVHFQRRREMSNTAA